MSADLSRLLRPRSIAVIGGGAWCAAVVEQCRIMGFAGPVWPVHPRREHVAGVAAFSGPEDLPGVPDAVFVGVNRHATIETVRQLSGMGAGGAVCFASGFRESQAETGDGGELQDSLLRAAGRMPILGPNCYGIINYLDGALLWPDQHGGQRCERGVAVLTQSSNIAINLTMQARGLPLAFVITAGNQAQLGVAEIGQALLGDDRVTALGLHIEGVGDLRAFEALAAAARDAGKPIIALKAGRSERSRAAAVSHTASLTGSDAGGRALLERLGVARVDSLPAMLETLKLVHFAGSLPVDGIASMSCSGGEASLVADSAEGRGVTFPTLTPNQVAALRRELGPMVALANPLDYHTYIWDREDRMAAVFAAMLDGPAAIGLVIVDFPRADRCDPGAWECVITAASDAASATGKPLALVATLPEAMPEDVAARCVAAGLVPMAGLDDALMAVSAAAWLGAAAGRGPAVPVLRPGAAERVQVLSEAASKAALEGHGLPVPRAVRVEGRAALDRAVRDIGPPVALKAEGHAHKTEADAVALGLATSAEAVAAAGRMGGEAFLVERMVTGGVAELLIGVTRDPAHGFVLTLGAGGTLTELMADSVSMLLPVTPEDVQAALSGLRAAALVDGYRGKPPADRSAIVRAVMAVQAYVTAHAAALEEVEINPLICTPGAAVAADALIRIGEE
ncbi:CoA-binding protein [Roseovarius sp. TE539]|uniref:acetate--CoA ligase family protein n=1 Tax=Roseovarius sp. TE539 TaxID=2249812 RepID=UPI000DDCF7E7|nr:acetate--CoA ligase family protein [Roseovarius sp. TE539]RBI68958.1 CoA-binding protein [Roseovarius sp. TE539]